MVTSGALYRAVFGVKIAMACLAGVMLVAFAVVVMSDTKANAQTMLNLGGDQTSSKVDQVSVGVETTCAVKDYWAYCWGSNSGGMLGLGRTDGGSTRTTPVKVADNKDAIPAVSGICSKKSWFGFGPCVEYSRNPEPAIAKSAMAGRAVTKVSVGKNHVCAIADAQAFCWGSNNKGQLGNRSNTNSIVPVAVDVQQKDVVPPTTTNQPCGGWFQPRCKTIQPPTVLKSALGSQEVIDIVAGDEFTCALTSNGKVACWGEGSNGRLGTGDTKDVNFPVSVFNANGAVLANKRGIELSKASNATVCVLAVSANDFDSTEGNPYCWGYGMGSGAKPADKKSSTVACSKTSARSAPKGTSKSTYFDSNKPVQVSDTTLFSDVDANDYVTGLGTDSNVYLWGMHGYAEIVEYTNVKSCQITTCTGFESAFQLAGYSSTSRTTTQKNKTGGTTKNTNHYSGRATPSTKAKPWKPAYDGCEKKKETRYGYTKIHKFVEIGSVTPVASAKSHHKGLSALSGDAETGLFCGATAANVSCDPNGSSLEQGQTGSDYARKCTTTTVLFFFKSTTCDPAPTGPQQVVKTGWLSGKKVDAMDTASNSYTCVLANGEVGCWGQNNKGQLGVGDSTDRKVPTPVRF